MTQTNTTRNPLDYALAKAIAPTLDEAMEAYDNYLVDGGTDGFTAWNDKWASDYIDNKLADYVPLNFASLPFDEVVDAYYDYLEKGGKYDFPTWEDKCTTYSKDLTPPNSPSKPSVSAKAKKPASKPKASGKPSKPAADSKKPVTSKPDKPAVIAKSGKVEVTLTDDEKVKREAQLLAVTTTVRAAASDITTAYMRIGFQLWTVREKKLFLAADLKNVYEYAETAFGFKKSSAANFIAVCEKFSVRSLDNLPSDVIDPAFSMFGYTQLSVMLPLSDEALANVKPEMTTRDIKKVQAIGQNDESEDIEVSKPSKTVLYDGAVTVETWDRLLEKLETLVTSGKHIHVVVLD